jgi:hypothetical protein
MRYLPHYFVSVTCQGAFQSVMTLNFLMRSWTSAGWTCSWIMRHYDLCIVFVFIDFFSQIYALFVTLDGSRNCRFPKSNIFTHLTAKLRIAIAIMCLWKTWGAVDVCLFLSSNGSPTIDHATLRSFHHRHSSKVPSTARSSSCSLVNALFLLISFCLVLTPAD